jgi:hypothetical protein
MPGWIVLQPPEDRVARLLVKPNRPERERVHMRWSHTRVPALPSTPHFFT